MSQWVAKPCPVTIGVQTDFSEPMVRINTDPLDPSRLGWNEVEAWDELASYVPNDCRFGADGRVQPSDQAERATSSAIAREDVSPGDSIPKRLISPRTPCVFAS
jgi:hypothetical protein